MGEDLKIQTFVTSDSSQVTCHLASLKNEDQWDLKQVNFSQKGALSDWDYHLAWASEDSLNFDGSLKGSASIDSESIELDLSESQMYIADTLWTLQNRSFIKADDNDVFADIHLETHSQKFAFEHSGNPEKFVRYIEFTDFELANFTPSLKRFKTSFEGQLNGDFKHVKSDSVNQFYSKVQSDDVIYNHFPMGSLSLNLDYDTENDLQTLLGVLKVTQHNLPATWMKIPQQDFTDNSDIDWGKSVDEIDQQLFLKYKLDNTEIEFIHNMIKPMK